ncbi:hypothetical protein UP10_38575 [Bradyrhizobium sp. LTSPM299]|jgi:hypothetical protein|nr:hypothetical protein UP10_38575 [Bradyrhizobium sp. LTSPM299]
MPSQREIYLSSNGDRWSLYRTDDGRVHVIHQANLSSGGSSETIEISDFLAHGRMGPEQQALIRLIGSLTN